MIIFLCSNRISIDFRCAVIRLVDTHIRLTENLALKNIRRQRWDRRFETIKTKSMNEFGFRFREKEQNKLKIVSIKKYDSLHLEETHSNIVLCSDSSLMTTIISAVDGISLTKQKVIQHRFTTQQSDKYLQLDRDREREKRQITDE